MLVGTGISFGKELIDWYWGYDADPHDFGLGVIGSLIGAGSVLVYDLIDNGRGSEQNNVDIYARQPSPISISFPTPAYVYIDTGDCELNKFLREVYIEIDRAENLLNNRWRDGLLLDIKEIEDLLVGDTIRNK